MIDLLNFSFWSDLDVSDKSVPHPDRYAIIYNGTSYTGYWSLCAAVNRGKMMKLKKSDMLVAQYPICNSS